MPDLATALQQVLRQVREETQHWKHCPQAYPSEMDFACSCDWAERVEAEQARRMRNAIAAAVEQVHIELFDVSATLAMQEAAGIIAVRAAQQERGSAP